MEENQSATFSKIDIDSWERKEYFLHYYNDVRCTYSVTVKMFPMSDMPRNCFDISSVPWIEFTSFNLNVFSTGSHLPPKRMPPRATNYGYSRRYFYGSCTWHAMATKKIFLEGYIKASNSSHVNEIVRCTMKSSLRSDEIFSLQLQMKSNPPTSAVRQISSQSDFIHHRWIYSAEGGFN